MGFKVLVKIIEEGIVLDLGLKVFLKFDIKKDSLGFRVLLRFKGDGISSEEVKKFIVFLRSKEDKFEGMGFKVLLYLRREFKGEIEGLKVFLKLKDSDVII